MCIENSLLFWKTSNEKSNEMRYFASNISSLFMINFVTLTLHSFA